MTTKKRQRSRAQIHASIRKALGYDSSDTDEEIYDDWKERTSRVCKPCWELKYCPYGPLVEQSPLLPSLREAVEDQLEYFRECLKTGVVGSISPLTEEFREYYQEWSEDEQLLPRQALNEIQNRERLEAAGEFETEDQQIAAWLGGELPPIHIYRTKFNTEGDEDLDQKNFSSEVWYEIKLVAEKNREMYIEALNTGVMDNRRPLEPARAAWFKKRIEEYSADDHPESIPSTFSEAQCNVFGHICPVFFAAEAFTESAEDRRIGRHHLNFRTMMRIVRRDDYRCQHCHKKLRDFEVEFDHIIPVSKGGSSEEHNIRLTCYRCNKDKSDNYDP